MSVRTEIVSGGRNSKARISQSLQNQCNSIYWIASNFFDCGVSAWLWTDLYHRKYMHIICSISHWNPIKIEIDLLEKIGRDTKSRALLLDLFICDFRKEKTSKRNIIQEIEWPMMALLELWIVNCKSIRKSPDLSINSNTLLVMIMNCRI